MAETERDNCRRIAEWLFGDVFCSCLSDNDGYSIHGYCRNNKGFESRQGIGHCWSCNKRPMYYDFYCDESANALILEKLPLVNLDRRLDGWHCTPYTTDDYLHRPSFIDLDRKTAIVLAALAFIEAQQG